MLHMEIKIMATSPYSTVLMLHNHILLSSNAAGVKEKTGRGASWVECRDIREIIRKWITL